ncbi:MAG: type IVB secretion system protein IcmH/DotU [Gammaproteobacteria bacterium]
MSSDDPFSKPDDNDRTVIRRPAPGGRPAGMSQPAAPGIPQQETSPLPNAVVDTPPLPGRVALPDSNLSTGSIEGSGLNPLVDAATALLALSGQLRNTASQADVAGLREHVIQQIKLFEQNARGRGVTPETVLAARYIICTFLDETVLRTPWGSESVWSTQSLLSTFHNETWGGEKFYLILDRMLQEPVKNLDILELMYICLSLGFEGKFGVLENGRSKLLEVQDNLFKTIRMQRGDFERELSPHWKGVEDRRNLLVRYVPLWVVGALAGVLLLATYAGFRFILENSADSVYESLDSIGRVAGTEIQKD